MRCFYPLMGMSVSLFTRNLSLFARKYLNFGSMYSRILVGAASLPIICQFICMF